MGLLVFMCMNNEKRAYLGVKQLLAYIIWFPIFLLFFLMEHDLAVASCSQILELIL